ncbi:BrnT family toxin [Kushneria aurantia]|uniref:BrnT family toxin n=1 Tax=Kushneria aurantia TaxID=504092 RepID=A0ABV6FZC1_9GAMM
MTAPITFDPAKNRFNLDKHGVPLSLAAGILAARSCTFMDERRDYGEDRFVSFGYHDSRLYVVIWTQRDVTRRIISVRKANQREIKRYGRHE